MEVKGTPGELENEGVIEGTQKGYRHGCYGCMPMRNQSHHHSEHHFSGRERGEGERGREGEEGEIKMEQVSLKWSHTL